MESAPNILVMTHQFYSDAFTHLLYVVLGFLGFAGVIFPYLLQRQNTKELKAENSESLKKTENELKGKIEELVRNVMESEKKSIEDQLTAFKKKISDSSYRAQGGIHFVQARDLHQRAHFTEAADSYASAVVLLAKANDELNLQRAIELLLDVFPNVFQPQIKTVPDFEKNFNALISILTDKNENSRYTDRINKLKHAYKVAQERQPKSS